MIKRIFLISGCKLTYEVKDGFNLVYEFGECNFKLVAAWN